MKILFFGAKSYDIKSFDAYLDKEEYKDLDVVYIEPNLTPQTARPSSPAKRLLTETTPSSSSFWPTTSI